MNRFFRLILAVLCSLILVGILEFSGIHLDMIGGAIIFLFVVICMILFIIARSFNSLKLLHKGQYSKAIEGFKKTMQKYGNNAKIVNAMLYNIAVCNYRKGDFCEMEAYLNKIDLKSCDDNVKWGYFFAKANSLILLEENINGAIEYHEKAAELLNLEGAYPVKAYFEAVKGNQKEALMYINAYFNNEKRRKVIFDFKKSTLVYDKFVYDIENNYFLGMTYLKLNEPQLAKEYFSKASKCKYENYISKKAGEYLNNL
jgi:tetratricopeptide (TPR) repeat protein